MLLTPPLSKEAGGAFYQRAVQGHKVMASTLRPVCSVRNAIPRGPRAAHGVRARVCGKAARPEMLRLEAADLAKGIVLVVFMLVENQLGGQVPISKRRAVARGPPPNPVAAPTPSVKKRPSSPRSAA